MTQVTVAAGHLEDWIRATGVDAHAWNDSFAYPRSRPERPRVSGGIPGHAESPRPLLCVRVRHPRLRSAALRAVEVYTLRDPANTDSFNLHTVPESDLITLEVPE